MEMGLAGKPAAKAGFNLPQPIWLMLSALAIGLAGGLNGIEVVRAFSSGFGRVLGDFALVLLPSFVLAACMAKQQLDGADRVAAAISPATAAGMICPDTSYATLASVADRRKLSVAFGSGAGYRLLFPAGPLIVATGLGVNSPALFLVGLLLLGPVWLAGELWSRHRSAGTPAGTTSTKIGVSWQLGRALAPLAVLGALLLIGSLVDLADSPLATFLTRPKGALIVAAALALAGTKPLARRDCLDTGMRRTAVLLMVIGAASAFGSMLSAVLPLKALLHPLTAVGGVLATLFVITMMFKLFNGASTATFATVTPVLAPIVAAADISPVAAVFAICLGSFALVPTDSFYWLVRHDALAGSNESSALTTLAGGTAIQALVGIATLYALTLAGLA